MNRHISNVYCDDCGQETRDDAYLCDTCCDKVARHLGEIPWLDDELDTTIAKIKAVTYDHNGAGGSPDKADSDKAKAEIPGATEFPMPLNMAATIKRDALRHALVVAVRFCTEEGVRHRAGNDDLPLDNIQAMSRWLLWRVDGLALNDMGPQVLTAVVNAVKACKRTIDKPPERRYAGPCPECKRDLYHRPEAAEVSCQGCGQRFGVQEVGDWMRGRLDEHLADRLVTTQEAKTLLGRYGMPIEQKTIEKWVERKRLVAHGDKPRVYRWDDVRVLAAQHHAAKGA